ncbi:hypothetical protein AVEN_17989-1, partial [Araneus ventricosus]
ILGGRSGLMVKPRLQGRSFPGSKPDSTEEQPSMWADACLMSWAKSSPANVVQKLGEEGASSRVVHSSTLR